LWLSATVLKGTRRSQLGPLVIFLLLVARLVSRTGFGADNQLGAEGYVEITLAALVLAIACANLIRPPSLILDERGFAWRSWRASGSFPWPSIDSFFLGPAVLGGKAKIAFNFLPNRITSQIAATELNRSMNGFDRSMANVWNIPSQELVDLLNGYVSRARKVTG
jgi:hypothetical protein